MASPSTYGEVALSLLALLLIGETTSSSLLASKLISCLGILVSVFFPFLVGSLISTLLIRFRSSMCSRTKWLWNHLSLPKLLNPHRLSWRVCNRKRRREWIHDTLRSARREKNIIPSSSQDSFTYKWAELCQLEMVRRSGFHKLVSVVNGEWSSIVMPRSHRTVRWIFRIPIEHWIEFEWKTNPLVLVFHFLDYARRRTKTSKSNRIIMRGASGFRGALPSYYVVGSSACVPLVPS